MNVQSREKGAGLILAMVFVVILGGFAVAILTAGTTTMRSTEVSRQVAQSRLLSQTAMDIALAGLRTAGGTEGVIGTADWTDTDGDGLADWDEVKDLIDFASLAGNTGPDPFILNPEAVEADQRVVGRYWSHADTPERVLTYDAGGGLAAITEYTKIYAYGRLDPLDRRKDDLNVPVVRYEMIVKNEIRHEIHEAFSGRYGIWAGGGDGYQLRFMGQAGGGPGNSDQIYGDIYVDGDVASLAASQVHGNIYATGNITGRPPTGTRNSYTEEIIPPDFSKLKGDSDIDVGAAFDGTTWTRPKSSTSWTERGNIVSGGVTTIADAPNNPAHIFAKNSFTSDAMGDVTTTVDNYQLGDWVSSNSGQTIRVYDGGNHKSYYVPGNLWIDPQGYGPTFYLTDPTSDEPDGVQITIIVEGNVYIGDEMYYEGQRFSDDPNDPDDGPPGLNGVAIIAVQARDADGNPITRTEGSGNIFFGDLNRNVRGLKVNAMLMAENDFHDKVLKDGVPLEFTINGLMAAGGELDLVDRGAYANYAPMTIRYDPRLLLDLDQGGIRLPNLPTSDDLVVTQTLDPGRWNQLARWRARGKEASAP